MATNKVLQVQGTQLMFRDVTDFPNTGSGPPTTTNNSKILGTPTEVQMDMTNVQVAAGHQSAKTADLGTAWSLEY